MNGGSPCRNSRLWYCRFASEINIALRHENINVSEVVSFLQAEKPEMTHVVLTGQNAKEELMEAADLVTEMELVKHPFRSGVKAQAGVEY